MRQSSKAIEAFIKEIEADFIEDVPQPASPDIAPAIGKSSPEVCCEPPKGFSFFELKKNARIILLMTAANLTSMYKSQGKNKIIEDAKFLEFHLGSNELVGKFKTFFINNESSEHNTLVECVSFVSWNGSTMKIY